MPEFDSRHPPPISGALARLERRREELAKAWIMRVIGRASLEEIRRLPADRIGAELPELISHILRSAAVDEDPFDLPPEAVDRAALLGELCSQGNPSAAKLARDIAGIEAVILDALRTDSAKLDRDELARLAGGVGEAVATVGAGAVDAFVARRSRELEAQSGSDPLAGLFDRGRLGRTLRQSCDLAKRYAHPFALLLLTSMVSSG